MSRPNVPWARNSATSDSSSIVVVMNIGLKTGEARPWAAPRGPSGSTPVPSPGARAPAERVGEDAVRRGAVAAVLLGRRPADLGARSAAAAEAAARAAILAPTVAAAGAATAAATAAAPTFTTLAAIATSAAAAATTAAALSALAAFTALAATTTAATAHLVATTAGRLVERRRLEGGDAQRDALRRGIDAGDAGFHFLADGDDVLGWTTRRRASCETCTRPSTPGRSRRTRRSP